MRTIVVSRKLRFNKLLFIIHRPFLFLTFSGMVPLSMRASFLKDFIAMLQQ